MSDSVILTVFCRDMAYDFARDANHSFTYFGGPLELKVSGIKYGPKPLHHVATLFGDCLPELKGIVELRSGFPLIYGLCYSGCRMQYKPTCDRVELVSLTPTISADDWPYRDYPTLLPYFPLKVAKTKGMRYEKWAEAYPNMPDIQPADLVVAIPPPADIGVTLWGGHNDAEGITMVFECNLTSFEVNAYNVCT